MGDSFCFLIAVLYESQSQLLWCALKVHRDRVPDESILEYPMEPESRTYLHSLLPEHVRSCGQIVQVEKIFEITIKDAVI